MPVTIIMGGQWGDEGKGKLTDALAATAHVVVRANGGSNAGHTVQTPAGVFKFRLVPSGILNPGCLCVIGAGAVVDVAMLVAEMDSLEARGIDTAGLRLSDRAHLVLPYHPRLDRMEEAARVGDEIGTTLSGNGPAYADKVSRRGIRAGDMLDPATLDRLVRREVAAKNRLFAITDDPEPIDPDALLAALRPVAERLAPLIVPAEVVIQDAIDAGRQVMIECAQGPLLDVDYGTYPFGTSSSPTAAGACQGAGVAPTQVDRVIAVFKAYSTRVGAGPMPTELHDATGDLIRERGREYGTGTGRPRRTGWFDAVAARHVVRLNGVTEIALTLVDVLDAFPAIPVCVAYRLDGQEIHHPPANIDALTRVAPTYDDRPGWGTATDGARHIDDLPGPARDYVTFIEARLRAPIRLIGVGPDREQLIPVPAGLPGLVTA
ncbi:MAG: adenylosuccinate synthase [Chloroflexota bacterium]|nr:adenylosuccinate synthase [Chloroflexota bacterium]